MSDTDVNIIILLGLLALAVLVGVDIWQRILPSYSRWVYNRRATGWRSAGRMYEPKRRQILSLVVPVVVVLVAAALIAALQRNNSEVRVTVKVPPAVTTVQRTVTVITTRTRTRTRTITTRKRHR